MRKLILPILIFYCIFFVCSCKKESNTQIDSSNELILKTKTATKITNYNAASGGTIINNGTTSILSRGICFSKTVLPTIADQHTSDGNGTGDFNSILNGLDEGTRYYLRSFATTSNITLYGDQLSITTPNSVSDIEGNKYNVITIGNQYWMQENLKVSTYRNGNIIPKLNDQAWITTTNGACGIIKNSSIDDSIYGRLYNRYAVADPSELCPAGWHVPDENDWNALVRSIDPNADISGIRTVQSPTAGGSLKEIGIKNWTYSSKGANNSSGFTARPAGKRDAISGRYFDEGISCIWWSSSLGTSGGCNYAHSLFVYDDTISRTGGFVNDGFSIRCVKN